MADDDDYHQSAEESEIRVEPSNQQTTERETAEAFLKQKVVKDAPRDQKENFLRSKGIREPEMQELLSGNESQVASEATSDGEAVPQMEHSTKLDTTPIITYPEFLLHSQRPRPLVTAQRLMVAAYVVSGVAATTYSASKFLLEPMLDELTLARHSLFDTASSNLVKLNQILESSVSQKPNEKDGQAEGGEQGQGSENGDGASYFSRTIATQTSPQESKTSSPSLPNEQKQSSVLSSQVERLSGLRSSLQQIQDIEEQEESLRTDVEDVQGFFSSLPHMTDTALMSQLSSTPKSTTQQVDGVAKVKAEIKGVKGVLLSARNFPVVTAR